MPAATAAVKSPRFANTASTIDRSASRHARRRMIDPTTCERDYGPEELEFMQALDRYKRTSGRMFPTCSEVLEVLRSLGYERVAVG
ncbi:MAG: hypothetical protein ACKO40_09940 [Planctomycetaceae bacterium]